MITVIVWGVFNGRRTWVCSCAPGPPQWRTRGRRAPVNCHCAATRWTPLTCWSGTRACDARSEPAQFCNKEDDGINDIELSSDSWQDSSKFHGFPPYCPKKTRECLRKIFWQLWIVFVLYLVMLNLYTLKSLHVAIQKKKTRCVSCLTKKPGNCEPNKSHAQLIDSTFILQAWLTLMEETLHPTWRRTQEQVTERGISSVKREMHNIRQEQDFRQVAQNASPS